VEARGQTGNGANYSQNGSAIKASVAGARFGWSCHLASPSSPAARFRPLFLWFISFGGAKEMNK